MPCSRLRVVSLFLVHRVKRARYAENHHAHDWRRETVVARKKEIRVPGLHYSQPPIATTGKITHCKFVLHCNTELNSLFSQAPVAFLNKKSTGYNYYWCIFSVLFNFCEFSWWHLPQQSRLSPPQSSLLSTFAPFSSEVSFSVCKCFLLLLTVACLLTSLFTVHDPRLAFA